VGSLITLKALALLCGGKARWYARFRDNFRLADQLDGIESITSILWFVQLAPPPPKLLLPTNRLAPSLIRWCNHH